MTDRLSRNFTLTEFRCGCGCQGHLAHRAALQALAQHTLEPLRAHWGGRSVRVTSGYRCAAYNRAVGGGAASQHLVGGAADVKVTGHAHQPGLWLAGVAWGLMLAGELPKGGVGTYGSFTDVVHVDNRGHLARWHKGHWPS